MLIYTSRNLGWGQQKPKQWGPLSAVRSAVLTNAERMGIDPSKVKVVLPIWYNKELINVIDPLSFSFTLRTAATVIDKDRVDLNNTSGTATHWASNSEYLFDNAPFSLFMGAKFSVFQAGNFSGRLISTRNTEGYYLSVTDTGALLWFKNSTRRGTAAGSLSLNTNHNIGFTTANDLIGANSSWYIDGKEAVYGTTTNGAATTANGSHGTTLARESTTAANVPSGFYLDYMYAMSGRVSEEAALRLTSEPYALLQPVPQVYYFDMAPTVQLVTTDVSGLSHSARYFWRVRANT